MNASIIIPTHKDPQYLLLTLAGLARQTAPTTSYEVIIVNNGIWRLGEVVGTAKKFNSGMTVHVVATPTKHNVNKARNQGAESAKGELLIFLDEDLIPAPEFVEQHLNCQLKEGQVTIGYWQHRCLTVPYDLDEVDYGEIMTSDNARLVESANRMITGDNRSLMTPDLLIRNSDALSSVSHEVLPAGRLLPLMIFDDLEPKWIMCGGGNISYTQSLFEAIGGFDDDFSHPQGYGLEDLECAYRAQRFGAHFIFCRKASACHQYHPRDRVSQLKGTFFNWKRFAERYDTADIWLWMSYRILGDVDLMDYNRLIKGYGCGNPATLAEVEGLKLDLEQLTARDVLQRRKLRQAQAT